MEEKKLETVNKVEKAAVIVTALSGAACGLLGVVLASKGYKNGYEMGFSAGVVGTLNHVMQSGADGWTVEGLGGTAGNNWKFTATKL